MTDILFIVILAFLILLSLFLLYSCNHNRASGKESAEISKRPDDLVINLYYDTGPVPDDHYYSYSITIGPGSSGVLEFTKAGQAFAEKEQENFTLDEKDLDKLYSYLLENNILRNDWKSAESLDGAPNMSISVSTGSTSYHTGQIPELVSDDCRIAENAFEHLLGYVPEELIKEMHSVQIAY